MTSPLPRKRPITARVGSKAIPTTCKQGFGWLCLRGGLVLLLLAGAAKAQQTSPSSDAPRYTLWPASPPKFTTTALQKDAQPPMPGQPLARPGGRAPEEWEQPAPYTIQLEPPSIYRVAISVESDAQLQERIRQENRERKTPERIVFPNDPIISLDSYQGRKWYPMRLEVAPYCLCHGRLFFQQINAERYGWDFGVVAPLVSGLAFLYDFVTLPYHLGTEPCRVFEYNTGWCLPGDPVPLLLYPFQPSPFGLAAEVGTILTLVAVFP